VRKVKVKSKMIIIACLSVLSIVFALSCEDHSEKAFDVSGRVTDSVTALPLDSVHMIWDDTLFLPERPVYTDSTGRYILGVPQGPRIIYARKAGYRTKARGLQIIDSDVHNFDFGLSPE
jgi:hypothetical protein